MATPMETLLRDVGEILATQKQKNGEKTDKGLELIKELRDELLTDLRVKPPTPPRCVEVKSGEVYDYCKAQGVGDCPGGHSLIYTTCWVYIRCRDMTYHRLKRNRRDVDGCEPKKDGDGGVI